MTNPRIIIENAVTDDAEQIIRMKNSVWISTYPDEKLGITAEDIRQRLEGQEGERVPKTIERWKQMIAEVGDTQAVFVARKEGKVIGVVAPGFINGQRRLGALYVLPGEQKQGIGQKLLKKAIEWHGRNQDVFLHAASHNRNAIDFYEKNGFVKTGKVFEDPLMNEVEMVLVGSNPIT